jgi:predicted DsbA family dithiol-disulfide isomerase
MDQGLEGAPTFPDDAKWRDAPRLVWHWYDLICPFCYVGHDRSALLEQHGLRVVDLGFEIHPETPAGGRFVGPRQGPMYEALEREAKRAGLPLRWPDRITNSRRALAAVEWVRQAQPDRAREFRGALFRAHFAGEQDISDEKIILRHAVDSGVSVAELTAALSAGSADELLVRSERTGRRLGVNSTPSWLLSGRLVRGLLAREELEELARAV